MIKIRVVSLILLHPPLLDGNFSPGCPVRMEKPGGGFTGK